MKKASLVARASLIASCYIVLTLIANAMGLSSGVIQIRFSEALTILPVFTPAAISGLFIGCILSNIITGCALFDIIFGSVATLIGAIGTYALRNKLKWLSSLPPIISNALIIPFVLSRVYHFSGSYLYFLLTVGAGEIISCGVLGTALQYCLIKRNIKNL